MLLVSKFVVPLLLLNPWEEREREGNSDGQTNAMEPLRAQLLPCPAREALPANTLACRSGLPDAHPGDC